MKKRPLNALIRVNRETREELGSLKRGKERHEDVVKRLIDFYKSFRDYAIKVG